MTINEINKALAISDDKGVVDIKGFVDICIFETRSDIAHFVNTQKPCLKLGTDEKTGETGITVSVSFERGSFCVVRDTVLSAHEIADLLICGWQVILKYENGHTSKLELVPITPLV